jgi:hypothetical protein
MKHPFVLVTIVAVLCVLAGYIWLNSLNTRDFNFGPPFLIMGGVVGTVVGVIGLVVRRFEKKQ